MVVWLLEARYMLIQILGISDIPDLAQHLCHSCENRTAGFKIIADEIANLHLALSKTEQRLRGETFTVDPNPKLNNVGEGCYTVLRDLQILLEEHSSMTVEEKRVWDRTSHGHRKLQEIRKQLTSQVAAAEELNASLERCGHSLAKVYHREK
jgi:hypothetical protein